ncbi:probable tRNA(His) guanylyltransferase [Neodiprion pinetum]|uniref:Probable tRNA(His) guanylyltransferase n=1 Tax=Neodiprion lecontei TaxID=441921 RepID=A0A6J0BQG9_NEOLC|nr:probable tRNA(His) guanylyltransferase [Neodiprion lecontei]XP_046411206.1 probable tRNA(His) guanylyltransferase [Neodiprion fabricii]XP_046467381.1 probable tRNA(His) guanylyltransferase [Neodiprion pinetum]XP_046604568.1 probable tRNA(His) guanylyltransferase [Neodiprion virginianus]
MKPTLFRNVFSPSAQMVINKPLSLTALTMAKSKYEYVKDFEVEDKCLPNCWIVVRIDGRGFSKFAEAHQFVKPNDIAALELMNRAAVTVMDDFREIVLSYGQSDEYSFVFRKDTQLFKRRGSKLMSNVNSLFTSAYVYHWPRFFRGRELHYPPSFDARVVLYPTDKNLRDYLAWRQADVHVNNLYNTCFWNLVLKRKMTATQAEEKLRGTLAAHKNELLFQEFGINYNNEPPTFRKGTTLVRKLVPDGNGRLKPLVVALVDDIIGDRFWKENPEVIGLKSLATFQPSGLPSNPPLPQPSAVHVVHPGHATHHQVNNKTPAVTGRPNTLNALNTLNTSNEDGNTERNPEADKHKMQCEPSESDRARCKP